MIGMDELERLSDDLLDIVLDILYSKEPTGKQFVVRRMLEVLTGDYFVDEFRRQAQACLGGAR